MNATVESTDDLLRRALVELKEIRARLKAFERRRCWLDPSELKSYLDRGESAR